MRRDHHDDRGRRRATRLRRGIVIGRAEVDIAAVDAAQGDTLGHELVDASGVAVDRPSRGIEQLAADLAAVEDAVAHLARWRPPPLGGVPTPSGPSGWAPLGTEAAHVTSTLMGATAPATLKAPRWDRLPWPSWSMSSATWSRSTPSKASNTSLRCR